MKNPLNKAFSGWRIFIAIAIGLLISGWMVYRGVTQAQFIEVEPGSGNYTWVDANVDERVDIEDPNEFVLQTHGNYQLLTVSESLRRIEWTSSVWMWLFVACCCMVGRDLFYILRIRLLTRNQLSWKAGFYVIMLWEFASALSPGVVGGSAVAMFIMNRETIPFGKASAIVIITLFMDNLFYVVLIPFVFLFVHSSAVFPADDGSSSFLMWWFWIGFLVIFLLCVLLYLTIFWFPQLASRFLLFVFRLPFLRRWKFVAREWGKDIELASKEFKKEPRSYWYSVFLLTFASWTCRYLVLNAVLNAFLDLGFMDNLIALAKQLVLWIFMLVSITPGASGVAEYGFGALLSSFTSSSILLAGMAILWRLISYFPYLFAGSILLPRWIRRTKTNH